MHPKYSDLIAMLRKAERLGFVEAGTVKDVLAGEVWKNDYIPKRKL